MSFFKNYIPILIKNGHTVDIACNNSITKVIDLYTQLGCNIYSLSCARSPFSFGNIKAIKQLERIVEEGKYDIVHCHTPIAAAITRLACKKVRKSGTRVIYTAHGFHFYEGAPKINWLIYYTIEKLCSRYTDTLITINTEDYKLASARFDIKEIYHVPGVGIDISKLSDVICDVEAKKAEIGIPDSAKIILSVGELNSNKNHVTVIKALANLKRNDLHYVIAGRGPLEAELLKLATDFGVSERVHLIGYRNDVAELYQIADIFVFPSFREGLSVALMEAMACGLPCVVSKIRGNVDLIEDGLGGYYVSPNNIHEFSTKIAQIIDSKDIALSMSQHNKEKIKSFTFETVNKMLDRIYFKRQE